MTDDPKDIIYIDVDDEITAVIDKMQSSKKKIVALVLPKRAAVFQSVVNMKLLKRTADNEKKNVVLITSEAALLPLAGVVGLHVAKTPQSKPEIPSAPMAAVAAKHNPTDSGDVDLDGSASVGSLAGIQADEEAIEVDNSNDSPLGTDTGSRSGNKSKKNKDNKSQSGKKLKIPNFEKFRGKLFLGIMALVVLVAGAIMAFVVLPKATVTLKTDTSKIDTSLSVVVDPNADRLDEENDTLPAISKEFRKTDTEKVAATGEKNIGQKASGTVTLSVDCGEGAPSIPAGTGVSTNNLTFITETTVSIASFPDTSDGGCRFIKDVDVVAQNSGDEYNFGSGKSFTVAGFSAVAATNDDSMTGGTDKIVKTVKQEDIDKAKEAITKRAGDEAPADLKESISGEGYQPIEETLKTGTPTVTSTSKVGEEASSVTVTSTTVFTMLGIKQDDLKKIIEADATKKIDPSKQVIRDNGLSKATMRVEKSGANGQVTLSIQTTVVAGPEIDEESIRQEVAGKKSGDIQKLLKSRPGINEVIVDYSPFWVQSTPKNANKITIVVEGNSTVKDADTGQ